MKKAIAKDITKVAKKATKGMKFKKTKLPKVTVNRRKGIKDTSVEKVARNGNVCANQYQLDPRQKLAWDYYIDPRSDTFSNATKSAQKAGYTVGYSSHITTEKWWLERVRRLSFVSRAEEVLEEMLNMSVKSRVITKKTKKI